MVLATTDSFIKIFACIPLATKVLERMIFIKICMQLTRYISRFQNGFLARRSTLTLLTTYWNDVRFTHSRFRYNWWILYFLILLKHSTLWIIIYCLLYITTAFKGSYGNSYGAISAAEHNVSTLVMLSPLS